MIKVGLRILMSVEIKEWFLQMKMILNYPQAKQMIIVINYEVKCS